MTKPMPWLSRPPAPKPTRKAVKPTRKPAKAPAMPEWLLQAAMMAEFDKLEAEGHALSAVGDMNAGKRGPWAAQQAKAMGMKAGEPDVRLCGSNARTLFIEVKTTTGRKSRAQDMRHNRLAELGFTVMLVAPKDEQHAREMARQIAIKFVMGYLP